MDKANRLRWHKLSAALTCLRTPHKDSQTRMSVLPEGRRVLLFISSPFLNDKNDNLNQSLYRQLLTSTQGLLPKLHRRYDVLHFAQCSQLTQ